MSSSSSLSPSSRTRSSWLQIVLFTLLVYILLFSTVCCHAVPVWKSIPQLSSTSSATNHNDDVQTVAGEAPSRAETGDFDNPDLILQRCLAGEDDNVFVKTLCSLAMMHTKDNERTLNHQGFVKRGVSSADRSSFSAFNRFVNRMVQHANEVSDYQERLNRMQALGLLDNDYNVISVPQETVDLMRHLG